MRFARLLDLTYFFAGEHTAFPEGQYGTVFAAHLSGKRVAEEIFKFDNVNVED